MTTACRYLSLNVKLLILALSSCLLGACTSFEKPTSLQYTSVETLRFSDHGIAEPFGLAFKNGVLFVSDGANGKIWRISEGGGPEVFAEGLNTPSAIAFDSTGDILVADTGSHTIRRVAIDGKGVGLVAGVENSAADSDGPALSSTFNGPVGIAVCHDDAVYVSDTYNDRIRVVRGERVETVAGGERGFADGIGRDAKFDTPLGIACWHDKIVVADSGNRRIRVVEADGTVRTLAGSGDSELRDGPLLAAAFVNPTALAVSLDGSIVVADGNSLRVIGRRLFPFVETITGNRRGFRDGDIRSAKFNSPFGVAFGNGGVLYVGDSQNQRVRIVSDKPVADVGHEPHPPLTEEEAKGELASRWPFDPPQTPREVAGTLGEIRNEIGPENKPVWFHNGLDIAGAYGETALFIRDETVLDPNAAENFGTSRELLRMPLIGYIHLRLGRDKDNRPFDDPRFQFDRDASGKMVGVRVPRGAKFAAGDAIGTLNAMNHVHLIAGVIGREKNALDAIKLPGVSDSIAPVIENVSLFTADWQGIKPDGAKFRLSGKTRIVVRAYDRMDGNSERRRLGVYGIGYQLLSDTTPLSDVDWRIRFDLAPSNDAVPVAYAFGSRSGYTSDTIFNYIATNYVHGDTSYEDFLDVSKLAPGVYTLRVFAADYFGNEASRDIEVEK